MTKIKRSNIKQELVTSKESNNINQLYHKISSHIDTARKTIQRSIDTEMVKAYWLMGRDIIEEEQNGKERADYASYIIKELSAKLIKKYGRGFGVSSLKNVRQFYLTFQIGQTAFGQFNPKLGWAHYEVLMRIGRKEARTFYEIEAAKNCWSVRELKRQVGSLLFDRLAKSKDKETILKLSCQGQEIVTPEDAIKDPIVLEFLDIPESHKSVESKLEEALINNLQHFLLEVGKGFAFVARQKRLTMEGDHFYADLVFYSIPLKSYVVIDIKTRDLVHADLGQIQLYVNYFDREIRTDSDNPTIGLVLCTGKNKTMVEYFLGDKSKQIFASTYQFHLPTEEELEAELKREIKKIKEDIEFNKNGESKL